MRCCSRSGTRSSSTSTTAAGKLGTLTINGGLAQDFRGAVGTGSGGSVGTGYAKNYNYDDRLRYEEPPHFIDPVQGSWRVQREDECSPAAGTC